MKIVIKQFDNIQIQFTNDNVIRDFFKEISNNENNSVSFTHSIYFTKLAIFPPRFRKVLEPRKSLYSGNTPNLSILRCVDINTHFAINSPLVNSFHLRRYVRDLEKYAKDLTKIIQKYYNVKKFISNKPELSMMYGQIWSNNGNTYQSFLEFHAEKIRKIIA